MVYQKAMVLISYTATPWMKKGIFSSFFPALELPVARCDVESNIKQSRQDTSYQVLEIWQHWTLTH